jgi:hypothetical protein
MHKRPPIFLRNLADVLGQTIDSCAGFASAWCTRHEAKKLAADCYRKALV